MTIKKELIMKDPYEIFVSPNRPNIKFHVKKVKKHERLSQASVDCRPCSNRKGKYAQDNHILQHLSGNCRLPERGLW